MIEFTPQPYFDQAALEARAADCTGCSEARVVAFSNGIRGVLTTAPEATTTVMWLQGGNVIKVVGPPATFTPDRAISVANALSAVNAAVAR
jgi:hypothetical protein